MAKRAIIFDFDGTIADSFPAVIEVFEDLTKQPKRLTAKQIEACKNLSGMELMNMFHIPRWKVPILFFRGRRMLRRHMDGIHPHNGMVELIQTLHGIAPLYIVSSNSKDNIDAFLRTYGLEGKFKAVYGNASAFAKARTMLKLIGSEHIDPARSWYIGDETRDVSAAHAVDLHIASVSWGYNGRESLAAKNPDALVDTAPELLRTLEAAWKK